ncbi:efflux RND transporter permease subunit [Rubripirellula reticaptiva]|uniref:Cobalt-zinc-cadmium resistance protein CzcA n=1 Tax=Rubripirellula reticaptiva TaxID=2528013 RepID=A0A5C6EEB6_9BACT|nr:efflux RND transporter permease subunit [Rubripirellula reticaptiva]TWU47000.1 Cobalt-zinc-cadmium resistance protein CzcA [Rubripirellula reticaptiva]
MNWLIKTSLQFRLLVLVLAVALVIVGVRTSDSVPLDVFPEFAPPLVEIQTEAPGISTEDVESLITVPIENAVNGIPFVQTVRSKSVLGLSSVRLIFEPGTDLLTARQLVQERLALAARTLPMVARPPVILPPLSSLSRCLKIGLWSNTQSQMEMTVLTKWTIRPRLMSIAGVANIAVWGEKEPQLQVVVDPDRLRANSLTLDAILQTVRDATAVGAGGFVDTANQRLALRHVPAVYTPEQLGEIVVGFRAPSAAATGPAVVSAPLRLKDVAEVTYDYAPPIGDAIINSRLGLLLIVEKQPWANTLDVTRNVEKAMAELKPAMGEVEYDTTVFRPATFIERALANLGHSMLVGCVLVVIVLLLFLFDWRCAVISATAIPLSLLAAVMVLYYRGGTVNTMVLAGLVIALGEVVDDAIIDVENIMRRLRLNAKLKQPRSNFAVVLEASMEVRSAVVYATVIVVLAFLPVFFLTGLAGAFFRPLAAAYILAILASLFVALTVTPAMSLILLPKSAERRSIDGLLVRLFKRIYRTVLGLSLRLKWGTIAVTLVLFGCLVSTIPMLGERLMPKFRETDFLMHWVEKPGIGIDAMNRITIRASDELMAVDGVRNFGSHIGRATVADEVVGPNFTELWISIDDTKDYDATVAEVQEIVDGYPGLYRDLLTYLTERIKEVLTGTSASIVVRIYGPDLDQLRATAKEIESVIKPIEGVATLKVEPQVLVPQIAIDMKVEAASQFGLTPGMLMNNVTTLVNGTQFGEMYRDQAIFPVVVRGEAKLRTDLATLGDLMIDTPSGAQVPLSSVASLTVVPAPNVIQREGASRRLDVTCNVEGRDLASVATEIEAAVLANVKFKTGYHPEFLGEYAEAKASRQRLLLLSLGSILAITIILYIDFESWRLVLLILLALPLALASGLLGVFAGGGIISLGSLVGFVTVLGIAARNAIMLISHYRHLAEEEPTITAMELILRGAEERLAPILMTALTTGLALVPLIYTGELPGQEIEYPMALVILCGLFGATIVNLLVLPVMYGMFAPHQPKEANPS